MLDLKTKILTSKGPALFAVGQAGFVIKSSSGQLLAIDLYLSDCVERLEGHKGFKRLLPQLLDPFDLSFDVVICTHPHLDHFDIDAVPAMVGKGGKLFGDFDITFVNCDHGQGAPDAVGVVVKVDGKTIYEVGDSCLRLDWADQIPQPLDVLISPINGMYGNMNSDDTVKLAQTLHPAITIPCHYGMFASHGGDLKRFFDLTAEKQIPALIMQQGEEYKLK